jgi:hypothetical protein
MRLDWLLADVEKKAARCLADNPQADHAQDLARAALELVRTVREGEHPYRDATAPSASLSSGSLPTEPTESSETTARVTLERALEECQQRLAHAERELAKLQR